MESADSPVPSRGRSGDRVFDFGGPVRALVALAVAPECSSISATCWWKPTRSPTFSRASQRAGWRGNPGAACAAYIAPQLLALAGVSVSIAFGAAIPIEALCDLPGIGQLAWQAATARDLPLLLAITFLVIAVTQICNTVSDWAGPGEKRI